MKKDWTDDYLNNFNNMSKEKILEEFDKISPEFGKWRMDRNMARAFLSHAIDQTREETIRGMEIDLDGRDLGGVW